MRWVLIEAATHAARSPVCDTATAHERSHGSQWCAIISDVGDEIELAAKSTGAVVGRPTGAQLIGGMMIVYASVRRPWALAVALAGLLLAISASSAATARAEPAGPPGPWSLIFSEEFKSPRRRRQRDTLGPYRDAPTAHEGSARAAPRNPLGCALPLIGFHSRADINGGGAWIPWRTTRFRGGSR